MGTPYLGEIRIVAFGFPPRGWAFCNGQVLPINQNQALFSLLGTQYGGDGRVTFALPDLRGRVPVHASGGAVLIGEQQGAESHTLTSGELPTHGHTPGAGTAAPADQPLPTANLWADGSQSLFAASGGGAMSATAVAPAGGGQPHPNMPPFLTLTFAIALTGIFPSRN